MRGRPSLRLLGTMNLCPNDVRLDTEIDIRLSIHKGTSIHKAMSHTNTSKTRSHSHLTRRTYRNEHSSDHLIPIPTSTRVSHRLPFESGWAITSLWSMADSKRRNMPNVKKARWVGWSSRLRALWTLERFPSRKTIETRRKKRPPVRTILKRTGSSMPVPNGNGLQRTASSSSAFKRTTSVLGTTKRSLAFGRVRSEVVVRGLGEPGIELDTPKPVKSTKPKDPTSSAKGKGSKAKGKNKAEETDDPFTEEGLDAGTMLPKMMARVKSGAIGANAGGGEEAANKALIKRLAQSALDTYGLDKDDEGFKEVYGYVTRGLVLHLWVLFYAGLL
ncbi:hypothetical protein RhiLY_11614 [Ceratobasidium sp. AG-Ba]|nr:hypothetical protein RhiLY_11614 [Ceratobasidium sp. AG-Ba]